MAEYIISPDSAKKSAHAEDTAPGEDSLSVCELFVDAVQGEGAYSGCPAIFLRLSGCHLKCSWCDTADVWNKVTRIPVSRLLGMFKDNGLIQRLENGHHLVVTGGSPLLQQDALTEFLMSLHNICARKPFIEVENECCIAVSGKNDALWELVGCWNNSPKLEHSGIPKERRYRPQAIEQMKQAREAWFKFVVNGEEDWPEICADFIDTGLITASQIILMPQGQTREELSPEKKERILDMAVRHNARYGGRLHIDVYDNRKGV